MKVYIETRLTPAIKVYDPQDTGGPGIMGKILAPRVILTDNDGKVLYEYGEDTRSLFPVILGGLLLLVAGRWL